MTEVKAPLTKEQKLANIDAQIAKLTLRRADVEAGIETKRTAKAIALPLVGDLVEFKYGRTTATSAPVLKVGTVVAVKPAVEAEGKKLPAQVKVQIGEGFDAELVVIYPAQIVVSAPVSDIAVV